jgi:hypothetical protein
MFTANALTILPGYLNILNGMMNVIDMAANWGL